MKADGKVTITVPVTSPIPAPQVPATAAVPTQLTYTRREAAQALGVSLPTLDAFMRKQDHPLPFIKHGYKKVMIPVDDLKRWVSEEAAICTGIAAARR